MISYPSKFNHSDVEICEDDEAIVIASSSFDLLSCLSEDEYKQLVDTGWYFDRNNRNWWFFKQSGEDKPISDKNN